MAIGVNYARPLTDAVFLRRYKRFFADVELADGSELTVHCANTGTMMGCTEDRAPCRIWDSDNPKRKLRFTLEQICVADAWIMVNTARTNKIVGEALRAGRISELTGYDEILPEQRIGEGKSRLDFLLKRATGRCWVEVKNVTLCEDGVAMFPDAVSERGARHLDELAAASRAGDRAVLIWHVATTAGRRVHPADHIDPHYGERLRAAVADGVELLAYACEMDARGVTLGSSMAAHYQPRASSSSFTERVVPTSSARQI